MWKKFCKNRIVKFLASLKLAVCVISTFTVLMIWGTITESRYGPEFAKDAVYMTPPFIITQIFLFLNILFAALVRLPFRVRLSGFYIIHLGLLTLLTGSAITALHGIDGSLQLLPGEANANVTIKEPRLYVRHFDARSPKILRYVSDLPRISREATLGDRLFAKLSHFEIYIERYLPYATARQLWQEAPAGHPASRLLWVNLAGMNMQQKVELSSMERGQDKQQMGPLKLALLMQVNSQCFAKGIQQPEVRYVYQDGSRCLLLNDIPASGLSKDGVRFQSEQMKQFRKITVSHNGKAFSFFPDMSHFPVTNQIQLDENSDKFLIALDLWRQSPTILFFNDKHFAYGKGSDWTVENEELFKEYTLPWMGLQMKLTRDITNKIAHTEWSYEAPEGSESQRQRAALIRIRNSDYPHEERSLWVDNLEPTNFQLPNGEQLQFLIGSRIHTLPFQVELEQFKMATNPGTSEPASFESFVIVNDASQTEQARIYMNNPLKKGGFTLYQASYFPLGNDKGYGSVLSVNRDPGRPIKYLGSILLIAGAILHFNIRAKSRKTTA